MSAQRNFDELGLSGALSKPSRERYGDVIYDQIVSQILAGAFQIGDRLPSEQKLAEIFEVSRPTVRQAIKKLQSDGLVESRRGSGHIVRRVPPMALNAEGSGLSIAALLHCFEARRSLEGETARLAALRATSEDIDRLRLAIMEMRKEFSAGLIRPEIDLAFHQTIVAACGNPYLQDLFNHLTPVILGGVSVTLSVTRVGSKERAQRILDEHERVFEAIGDRDGESASLAMRYHLDQAKRRLTDGSRVY